MNILDYSEFCVIEKQLEQRRATADYPKGYDIWERYDSAIREVMAKHGMTVGWDEDVDFYHGGEWFHELYDGFALRTTRALSMQAFPEFQSVVAAHHPDATLDFGGEMGGPMDGLSVIVTAATIYVAWYDSTAATCTRLITEAGVHIL